MKAIYITDMPKNCYHCQFKTYDSNDNDYWCRLKGNIICDLEQEGRPAKCPLKALRLPNTKEQVPVVIKNINDTLKEVYEYGVLDGYNECVREVLGWNESNTSN